MAENIYRHQHKSNMQSWTLILIFLGIVIGVGLLLSYVYEAPGILYFAIAISLLMNIWAYWFSHKTVLRMARAKKADRKEYFDLYTVTENLSIAAGLPMPALYVIDDASPNAFATGRNKKHAIVAVTTGLLEILERNELEGVIAHELSHIGNRDMLMGTMAVVLVGVLSIIADIFLRGRLLKGGDRDSGYIGLIIMAVAIVLMPIAGTLLRLAISRKREYLADASGALLTRYPEGLAKALEKINMHNKGLKRAHHSMAHLYIANPFGGSGKKLSFIDKLFATHPPVASRLEALRGKKAEIETPEIVTSIEEKKDDKISV